MLITTYYCIRTSICMWKGPAVALSSLEIQALHSDLTWTSATEVNNKNKLELKVIMRSITAAAAWMPPLLQKTDVAACLP